MKIPPVGPNWDHNAAEGQKEPGEKQQKENNPGTDSFVRSTPADKADDVEMYDELSLQKLKQNESHAYNKLRQTVIDLLERQGHSADAIKEDKAADVEVDETAQAEAEELIGENGPWGAEAVSDRIVEFARLAANGDKEMLADLREAIEEGFRQAERILGGLPDVSNDTYDLVMEKLDELEGELAETGSREKSE